MRRIAFLTGLCVIAQTAFASDLILVNKGTGEKVGPLIAGEEISLNGTVYVITERAKIVQKTKSPEEVLHAYFACEHWEDRIPLVVDQDRVGKLMATYYSKGFGSFQAPRYVKIGPKPKHEPGEIESYIYEINVSGSDVLYVVQETKSGYKVNWERSRKLWAEALVRQKSQATDLESQITRKKFHLEDAVFLVAVKKLPQSGSYSYLRIDVKNGSKAFISSWTVAVSFYDKDENYLGQTVASGRNLRPGKRMFDNVRFPGIEVSDIDKWSLRLEHCSIEDSTGEKLFSGEKYFALEERGKKPDKPTPSAPQEKKSS